LVADGLHARTDGLTSLAVVLGALGVLAGWQVADPVVGLVITVAIVVVLTNAARGIYRRLMDAVDPPLTARVEEEAGGVPGVHAVDGVRIRWVGHELHAELRITVSRDLPLAEAHDIAEAVHHRLVHRVARLTDAIIHVDPTRWGEDDPHDLTAHHADHRH
jgi:cation diffusion facilitator family transporter